MIGTDNNMIGPPSTTNFNLPEHKTRAMILMDKQETEKNEKRKMKKNTEIVMTENKKQEKQATQHNNTSLRLK